MALKGASINEVKFPRMFAVIKPLKKLSAFVRHALLHYHKCNVTTRTNLFQSMLLYWYTNGSFPDDE